ncbi:hypothetical protein Kpol_1028p45 [Vanderwaltozyma polyspora DSM 70294]|uniref:pyridoxal kinase n=1 Tax=Vanderwaltozyma polyspora (strain ATCC 22028 / DSM 70294 / BCRC 21397 / CBS 2163 / NBRC 10782 / NRRL Y-8283 / UCD 57-17) TaxID=436907 RepID=A7TG14_VANPO|nr:uncharacterized protein Kpol_1028p45 [Vanderwaltozyma polyspora DSM 70294]EDO18771.1 hypothetical protein Kpol_1028p45 [Vanderwaltozyma polyspora DSM 70294]
MAVELSEKLNLDNHLIRTKKVLSIQSHVVHGYVGNKASTFSLQYKGWDVDALNTVQYSNHPGYGQFSGFKTDSKDISNIFQQGLISGLEIQYDAIITGYIPDIKSLEFLGEEISSLREICDTLKWILDPVLGDNGKMYLAEGIKTTYKNILSSSKIYLTTPNQFEMEMLTSMKINDISSLRQAFVIFHELYPRVENIVVTGIEINYRENGYITAACYAGDEFTTTNNTSNQLHISGYVVPKIPAQFSGSGDLFTSLIMNEMITKSNIASTDPNETLSRKLDIALNQTQAILQRTYNHFNNRIVDGDINNNSTLKINDLRLIQSRDILSNNKFENFKFEHITI